MKGLNLMDKTLFVQGARISFSIWDVAGDLTFPFSVCVYLFFKFLILKFSFIAFLGFVALSFDGELFCVLMYVGDTGSLYQIPMACKDSVAILIMFDLTSRCTLNR